MNYEIFKIMKSQHTFFLKKTLLLLLFLLLGQNHYLNAQILTNGNFESGGSGNGFFVHDYTLINPLNGTSNPGFYARTTNPSLMNSSYISSGDHTTGTGNMLVFDGASVGNRFFWTTGSTGGAIVGFTAGTTYTFSFWIKSVSNDVTNDDSTRANIGIFFVNANGINPTTLNTLAPLPSEGWQKVSYSFVATANNVMIRLRTINAGPIGNDFAVDDFSIVEGALPFTGNYSSINPTCPGATDGSITVSASGGFLPYGNYNLSGTATQSNTTGIFTGLSEGTYNVSVTDANNQVYSESNIILAVQNDLVLSNPATICEGESTTLTATGGIGTYTWTANPADSSITNPNSATQNVSPTVTTTYTVTSGQASDPTNLIVNGDFSQGNVGFITEYSEVADPNPFGVQSSYYIVTNPNAWFTAFASCGDHTTGSGNMMVFDGSTDPTGTIKVWSTETPLTVEPNTDYTFSYYIASVALENPAKIEVTINGVSLAAPVTAPATTCLWTLVSHNWNSGANTIADISMFNREFLDYGNDFALDDISLAETVTCIYEKTVTVTVNSNLNLIITNPAALCSGAAVAVDLTLAAVTAGSTPGTLTYWTDSVATIPLNNPNAMTVSGTYYIKLTVGNCSEIKSVTVTINPSPTLIITNPNPVCFPAVINLTSALITSGSSTGTKTYWTDSVATIPLNNPNSIANSGVYYIKLTNGSCSDIKPVTVTINPTPSLVITNPAAVCSPNTIDLTASAITAGSTGNGTLTYWSDLAATNPLANPNAVSTSGTYYIKSTLGDCFDIEQVNAVINQTVEPTFNVFGPYCAGVSIDPLPNISNNNISGIWNPETINNTTTTTYVFHPNPGQCATDTPLTITINPSPEFTISEGCVGSNYTLSAVEIDSNNSDYEWYNPSNIQIGTGSSVVVSTAGIYKLIVTKDGCSNEEIIDVLRPLCSIQKGISPNNDTNNDNFDLSSYNVSNLKIFNRYGTTVYDKTSYRDEWYGQSNNGDELPDGTYYYVIDFTDLETKTGWIYINREQ